jgi:hypothetical protein
MITALFGLQLLTIISIGWIGFRTDRRLSRSLSEIGRRLDLIDGRLGALEASRNGGDAYPITTPPRGSEVRRN